MKPCPQCQTLMLDAEEICELCKLVKEETGLLEFEIKLLENELREKKERYRRLTGVDCL